MVFPITIDPTYASGGTVTASFDTYVSSQYHTTAYSSATELRVGTYNGGGDKYRSFLTFPLTALKEGMTSRTLDSPSFRFPVTELMAFRRAAWLYFVRNIQRRKCWDFFLTPMAGKISGPFST